MFDTKCHKQMNPQERVRKAEVSSRTINWELCVFCQGKTNENLHCPANSKREDIGADTNLQRQVLVNSKGLEFLHSKWTKGNRKKRHLKQQAL